MALPPFVEIDLTRIDVDSRITFTRSTTRTYINAAGARATAEINEWPIDHDPVTLAPLGRSVWFQSTNLILNSATMVTQNCTVTSNQHTLSFEGTGTVTLSGVSTAGPLVGTGTGPANRVHLTFVPTAGTLTLTVSGTVSNAQLEAAVSPTPYIPTAGSTVTRATDNATINPLSKLGLGTESHTVVMVWRPGRIYSSASTLALFSLGNFTSGGFQTVVAYDQRGIVSVGGVSPSTLGALTLAARQVTIGTLTASGGDFLVRARNFPNNNVWTSSSTWAGARTLWNSRTGAAIGGRLRNNIDATCSAYIERIRIYDRVVDDTVLEAYLQ